ncbi:MAG: gamma-glutamyltransferase [Candidatus Hodarchaeales archaeon]
MSVEFWRRPRSGRSAVYAKKGLVASSQPLASSTGLSILKRGGSAVDAAIAMAAVLNVVEPFSTGIGGDAFTLIYIPCDNKVISANGSGVAPKGLSYDYLTKELNLTSIPLTGFLPITVPGAVSLWELIHKEYGKLSWDTVLEPAIKYAREGFPLSPIIAQVWRELVPKLLKTEGARKTYLINNERAPRVGEIFRQEKLALTLEKIARNGSDEFYKGDIAQRIDEFMEKNEGFVRHSDLKNYKAKWTKPIVRDFYNHLLWEHGPNGQGLVTLMMLSIAEELDISRYPHNSVEYLHCLIEAKKLAFADGFEYIADPDYMTQDVSRFLSEEYAQTRASQVNPKQALISQPMPFSLGEDTVYLTALDSEGLVVSFINSLFYGFGSGIVDPELGIAFQNRGAGFTLRKGHPNQYSPGKHPYHTIIPAMITSPENDFLYSFGVMGGHHQPQGQAQVFLNMVLFGMDPQTAIDAPRFHHEQQSNTVSFEDPISVSNRMKLRQKGHKVADCVGTNFGGGQIIKYDRELDSFCAGSDPRKDGQAQGY